MRRAALIIIVIGILLSGYPVHVVSFFVFEVIFGTVLEDYAEFFNLIPLLFVVLVVGGMITLAVALSIGEHRQIPAHAPSPIMVNVSYVKDIAVELAGALSHYFHTPMKIKSNNIVVDIDGSLFEEIRKFIEKFLERNKMHKHKLIWARTQFVILRLIPMERWDFINARTVVPYSTIPQWKLITGVYITSNRPIT